VEPSHLEQSVLQQHQALLHAFYYLLAAVIAVPFFRRWGLGAILGYLVAGVVIGPQVLGLIFETESAICRSWVW
jgi:glutathione-regulated potassium-efflux system protein KefB